MPLHLSLNPIAMLKKKIAERVITYAPVAAGYAAPDGGNTPDGAAAPA